LSRAVLLPFLAGVVVAVAAAVLLPLPEHPRFPSRISVQPDGGRREDFIIRWPADRIVLPRDERNSQSSIAAAGATVLEDTAGQRVSAELFRVRDTAGNVIGVASRMAGIGGALGTGHSTSGWMLVIPSRGSLFLTQSDTADVTARERISGGVPQVIAPAQTAAFWAGGSRYRATGGASGTGTILRGTREFDGLQGTYTETWAVGEVNADGSATGTITLSTVAVKAEAP
jgi:hypothetical protein